MKGRLLQRLRQLSISNSLRGAFLTGALLTLIVSMVSLYSWHEQSSQVRAIRLMNIFLASTPLF